MSTSIFPDLHGIPNHLGGNLVDESASSRIVDILDHFVPSKQ